MFHVKYRDFFGKLILCEGRTEFEDALSEAEDHVTMKHTEVEILVDLGTADVNMEEAAALSRGHSLLGAAGYGCHDDGCMQTEAEALR
jgi:hypothetical protein